MANRRSLMAAAREGGMWHLPNRNFPAGQRHRLRNCNRAHTLGIQPDPRCGWSLISPTQRHCLWILQIDVPRSTHSPLCARLQPRCSGTPSIQSPNGNLRGMPQVDSPTEMPTAPQARNGDGTDMPVWVPLDAGDASGDSGACTSCTPDGVRMECQGTR